MSEQVRDDFRSITEEPSMSSLLCNRTSFDVKNIWLQNISDRAGHTEVQSGHC